MNRFLPLFVLLLVFACKKRSTYEIPETDSAKIWAVIEIPAGSNVKIEYDHEKGFIPDTINGEVRRVDFLPYVGNYGFIHNTLMDKERGGDGDALDVLVLSSRLETGTVIPVTLIGALDLIDNGEVDTKLIAVPEDESLRVFQAENMMDLSVNYGAIKNIIELWFVHYKGLGEVESRGWKNEKFALSEFEKWKQKSTQ